MGSGSYGGVAAKMGWPASRHPDDNSDLLAAAAAAGAHPNFGYQGGPIIRNPQVYVSFWGPAWQADPEHTQRQANLNQFMQDFLASDYMNVLSQYGSGHGAGGAGTVLGTSNLASATGQMTDADIQTTAQSLVDTGTVPEPGQPSNMALMIFMDESIEINDPNLGVVLCEPQGDNAFGYHNFFTTAAGNQFYYSIIPSLNDACLQNSCPDDTSCSLHLASTQEQRQTQVASHEFAEMVTDPEISAWRDASNGAENGDICNGESDTITVGGNTWTVQRMYSYTDDINSGGAQPCITGAPAPIPPIQPGP
jgi:hypothetical protein